MMKLIRHIYWMLAAVLAGASCTKEATIKLPEQEEKLVVVAFISPGQAGTWVTVQSSQVRYDFYPNSGYLLNANVVVTDGNKSATAVFEPAFSAYFIPDSVFSVSAGGAYSLNVSVPGFPSITANTRIPSDTLTITGYTAQIGEPDEYMQREVNYRFTVGDLPGTTRVMLMHGLLNGLPNNHYYADWNSEFQTDETTSRSQFDLSASSAWYEFGTQKPLLAIGALNCSEEFFLYSRSVRTSANVGYNPFADPVLIYSNIQGGFGCFGGFTETRRLVTVN